jgi:hypothetical protein
MAQKLVYSLVRQQGQTVAGQQRQTLAGQQVVITSARRTLGKNR